ncbi:MAG: hypothetical protein R3200_09775 [Xanthomonadales bacterium]|nr:hypothetical protein [Xanthomonadales bacterium]
MLALRGLLLTVFLSLPVVAAAQVFGYAVNSDDQIDADQLLRINLETGETTMIGPLQPAYLQDVEGLAFDSQDALYGVDSATKTLVRIDLAKGNAELVDARQGNLGFLPAAPFDYGLTFTCSGQLLLVAEQTQSLYEVSTETGQARVIGQSGGLGDTMTAVASYGTATYALAADSGNFYRVDEEAGTATLVGVVDDFQFTDAGMAFDEAGTLWAISSDFSSDPSRIFTIDPTTAEVQMFGTTRAGVESLAISGPSGCNFSGAPVTTEPIPVNSTWALLLLLLSIGAVGGYHAASARRR